MAVSDAMRAQDWPEAERCIETCFRELEMRIPSPAAIPKMNVAASVIYYWNGKAEPCLAALEVTIAQLRGGGVRSLAEASYLARYCFELAEFGAGRFPDHEAAFLKQASRAQDQIVPFDLRRVRGDFRSLFPLADIPACLS